MLAEVVSSSPTRFSEEGKAVKRRRIGGKVISRHDGGTSGHDTEQSSVLAEDTDSDNHISEKAIQDNRRHIMTQMTLRKVIWTGKRWA
jgi:hypothetical protein